MQRHMPQDSNLDRYQLENLRSHIYCIIIVVGIFFVFMKYQFSILFTIRPHFISGLVLLSSCHSFDLFVHLSLD